MALKWDDPYEIGIELAERYPDMDPLALSFVKLHEMVIALEDFDDDPKESNEGKLEAIQMAWFEEMRDR